MITLRELVEQQREEQQEPCFVEEDEEIDAELNPEDLNQLEEVVDREMGQGWSDTLEHYKGKYDSGTMQKDRIPKYGPGKVKKNGECLY